MIPAGRHGGDGVAVAESLGLDPDAMLDLSATLNPFAPDLGPVVARHLGALRRYPRRGPATTTMAAALGVAPERVLLTNGGSEAIALVAEVIGGGVLDEPEFSLHPRSPAGPRWRSDPHSPTGSLAGATASADVWDEAFYPLATGRWTADRAEAITIGSLTKVFACPGLRLGYIVADDVDRFARRQPEWPVSTLALDVLVDLLGDADLAGWSRSVAEGRTALAALLADHGLTAQASDAPWVLVDAPGLRTRLAPHGVTVRDCASFGLPGTARIAVPDAAGLAQLAHALDRSSP